MAALNQAHTHTMSVALLGLLTVTTRVPAGLPPFVPRPVINPRFAAYDKLDLATMPTGDRLARHAPDSIAWKDVQGPEAKRVWTGEKRVDLRDLSLRVHWPNPKTDKYPGTLFLFRDCEEVTVEDLSVVHANADYRGQHTLLFENCGTVTVRNVFSAGAVGRYHIRLEGCGEYLIEKIEIAGWDYGPDGVRCGGGIHVNNGITKSDGTVALYVEERRELTWGVIRDSWFHDYLAQDGGPWRNQDGIAFHAPADGLVFNCVFDRWLAGDGAIDDSHRRYDPAYRNKVHRIERCVFRNCRLVKTNGATGSPDCVILWCNNLYVNTWLADYHKGWSNWHVHESYLFERRGPVFVKNWGMDANGMTVFANGLVHAPEGLEVMFWQSGKAKEDGYELFRAHHMLYAMPPPAFWVRGQGVETRERSAWLAKGFSKGTEIIEAPPLPTLADDVLPTLLPPPRAKAHAAPDFLDCPDAGLRVTRDFFGRPRPSPPTAGAFELP